jgi:hypothetical protein
MVPACEVAVKSQIAREYREQVHMKFGRERLSDTAAAEIFKQMATQAQPESSSSGLMTPITLASRSGQAPVNEKGAKMMLDIINLRLASPLSR